MKSIFLVGALLFHFISCAVPTKNVAVADSLMMDAWPTMNLHKFGDKLYYIGAIHKNDKAEVNETSFQGNYFQAMQFCNLHGMELVSIETKEENDFLWHTLKRFLAWGEFWFWTSGTTLPDNRWVWMSTGKPIAWANWIAGQPDNAGQKEQCLEARYFHSNTDLKWNDHVCTEQKFVLCESKNK